MKLKTGTKLDIESKYCRSGLGPARKEELANREQFPKTLVKVRDHRVVISLSNIL